MSRRVEEWRDIPGFDGFYQVSDWGNIRSFKDNHSKEKTPEPKPLKPTEHEYRRYVVLKWQGQQKTMQIARAVAMAFIGPIPKGMVAYHKNGNFRDNHEWNIGIGQRSKLSRERMRKYTAGKNRRPVVKIDRNLEIVEAYPSSMAAAKANGYRQDTMWRFCTLDIAFSVFAPDDYLYTFDDDTWMRKALERARAELDAMNARYNDPHTERYYDLPPEPDDSLDFIGLQWAEVSALVERGDAMKSV